MTTTAKGHSFMLHACPCCRKPGISSLEKRWSSRSNPATCQNCGHTSYVDASASNGIFFGVVMILLLAVVVAAVTQDWLFMVPAVALATAFNLWAWRRAEMWPIPQEDAKTAMAVQWTAGLFLVVLKLFQ